MIVDRDPEQSVGWDGFSLRIRRTIGKPQLGAALPDQPEQIGMRTVVQPVARSAADYGLRPHCGKQPLVRSVDLAMMPDLIKVRAKLLFRDPVKSRLVRVSRKQDP